MKKAPYTSINPYFLVPFLVWVVTGGIGLLFFDKQQLFSFFNTHYTTWSDTLVFGINNMGEAPFIVIVLMMLLGIHSLRNWWYFTTAAIANILPAIVTQIIKSAVGAPRPLKYFNEASWIHILPEWHRLMDRSFPSGHTCGAFSMYCLLACLLKPQYRVWGTLFFILALMVGYARMYVAAHFFADVYAGSIIGTTIAIVTMFAMQGLQPYFFKEQL